MKNFQKGDRVRIKQELADGYLLPMRKWAHEGRLGTVTGISPGGHVGIQFDAKRKPKYHGNMHEWIRAGDVELIERAKELI